MKIKLIIYFIIISLIAFNSNITSQTVGKDDWNEILFPSHPSVRHCFGMTFSGENKILLFGGRGIQNNVLNDSWLFNLSDSTWSEIFPIDKPSAREKLRMAYLGDNKVLLFGGINGSEELLDETWIYDRIENEWINVESIYEKNWNSGIEKPEARAEHAMSYLGNNQVLLFGYNYYDTWIYDGNIHEWINIEVEYGKNWQPGVDKPSSRVCHDMVFLSEGKSLLFGGNSSGSDLNDTWMFNLYGEYGPEWQQLYPSHNIWPRKDHRMVYIGDGKVVLFGGTTSLGMQFNDTWVYIDSENRWIEDVNKLKPTPRTRYAHGFAETSLNYPSYPMLFGGGFQPDDGRDFIQRDDTWIFGEGDWLVDLILNKPPKAITMPDLTVDEGESVQFNGSDSYDPDGEIEEFEWDPGDGNENLYGQMVGYIYMDNGVYNVSLTVTDNDGLQDSDDAIITVDNVPPNVAITYVDPNKYLLPGVDIEFTGEFLDPGELDTHTAEWDFADGTIEEFKLPAGAIATTSIHSYNNPGTYTLILTIEDDDGGSGSAEYKIIIMSGEVATQVIDVAIQDLEEEAFDKNSSQKKNALSQKLDQIEQFIVDGNYAEAFDKLLHDLRSKFDGSVGGNSKNDWIIDEDAQATITNMIDKLLDYLNSLLGLSKKSQTNNDYALPKKYTLFQNYPNPFNPSTNIHYGIASPGQVNISIYNINGIKVKTLVNSYLESGYYSILWDGKNDLNQEVSGGLYLCTINTSLYTKTIRMLLIR